MVCHTVTAYSKTCLTVVLKIHRFKISKVVVSKIVVFLSSCD